MASISEKIVIAVDMGGTTTSAGLVDAGLNVIERSEQDTDTSSQDALLKSLISMIKELSVGSPAPVQAVGFGIPSMIDQSRGSAVMSVNIPLADFAFVDYMEQALGLPVFIDNDANVAALAEARAGAAKGARQVIMLTLGTGIGGGIIIDGQVYRGATGSAAELGHMVIEADGPKCPGNCPNHGCFEAMAAVTALIRYAEEAAGRHPDSRLAGAIGAGAELEGAMLYGLAMYGDEAAKEAFAQLGHYLGLGITGLVNIFNPEFVVVGGGVARAGDLILDPATAVLMERGLRPNRDVVRVAPASFGPEAGMLGAACLALEEFEK